jgi:hypothetical protein
VLLFIVPPLIMPSTTIEVSMFHRASPPAYRAAHGAIPAFRKVRGQGGGVGPADLLQTQTDAIRPVVGGQLVED